MDDEGDGGLVRHQPGEPVRFPLWMTIVVCVAFVPFLAIAAVHVLTESGEIRSPAFVLALLVFGAITPLNVRACRRPVAWVDRYGVLIFGRPRWMKRLWCRVPWSAVRSIQPTIWGVRIEAGTRSLMLSNRMPVRSEPVAEQIWRWWLAYGHPPPPPG